MSALHWERIDTGHTRARVIGGWLIKAYELQADGCHTIAMTFIPDLHHVWAI